MNNLNKLFDHTFLSLTATDSQLQQLCDDGRKYDFKSVAVLPAAVKFCAMALEGTGVLVDSAISFPLGQATLPTKLFEIEQTLMDGAREIDYVINLSNVKNGRFDLLEKEMTQIHQLCEERGVIDKAILEICYLESSEITEITKVANVARPAYIKTSTGFGTGGATIEAVKLMRAGADPEIKIKASGGVANLTQVREFLAAGADRIGTSKGINIVKEWKAEDNEVPHRA